jgi:hypothetical protein
MPKPKKPAPPAIHHGPPDEDDYMLAAIPPPHQPNIERANAAHARSDIHAIDCQYVRRLIYAEATTEFVNLFITHAIDFYAKLKKSRKTQ